MTRPPKKPQSDITDEFMTLGHAAAHWDAFLDLPLTVWMRSANPTWRGPDTVGGGPDDDPGIVELRATYWSLVVASTSSASVPGSFAKEDAGTTLVAPEHEQPMNKDPDD